ncbi:hypothetical protein QFZ81_005333 [Paenibacillus sp. V4I9]|uniref:copper amine oxidase N-terminal domain-containing protein n=1 Tax=Paenibacillus sp. V4I9 TaxID=3042308 RepID=UPI0027878316|nr:copper amine oxidase N-terminal domain-containing protein [Paenibacillus sp. V4I9]MDQ0890245.1 hypothetical protein [Paenibacillus sp. V4I9]
MKTSARKFICIFNLLLFLLVPNVYAEGSQPVITVFLNDEQIKFDQDPVLVDGNTLVQFRLIFEKLGYSVEWEETTKRITAQRHGNKIIMVIGGITASANNISYILDKLPQIIDGSTVVPLRFIAEASGAVVTWDQDKHQINIKADRNEAPELKINRLIEGYAFSNSTHDFVGAITRSNGTKCNGYEVKGVSFENKGKVAIVDYTLDFWVSQPKLINSETTNKESMNITVEIKQKVISDEDGNWHLSPIIKDREYLVVPK